jgi:indolepyruvate ferredoxin oxidoreductase beta subunit
MIGFEPLETLRALNKCNVKTVVITNLSPLSPFTVTTGSGVYPGLGGLQALIRAKTAKLIAFNAVELAEKAGNILSVNMVLLGALAQTGKIPLSADNVKTAIIARTKKAFLKSNMKAFELGFSAARAIG